MQGYTYFSYFCSKTYVLSKNKKKLKKILVKFSIFTAENISVYSWTSFRNVCEEALDANGKEAADKTGS